MEFKPFREVTPWQTDFYLVYNNSYTSSSNVKMV